MGKKSSNSSDRSRNMAGMFYLESTSYNCNDVILKGLQYFEEFRYILHDKDIYTQEDYDDWLKENESPPTWQVGDLKKPHYHFVGHRPNACLKKTCANKLGLGEMDVRVCGNYKQAIRYLIHIDHEEKYQYDIADIKGNKLGELLQYFVEMSEYDGTKFMIELRDKGYTWRDVLSEMGKRGQYATFRRNYNIVTFVRGEGTVSLDALEYYVKESVKKIVSNENKGDNNASRDN